MKGGARVSNTALLLIVAVLLVANILLAYTLYNSRNNSETSGTHGGQAAETSGSTITPVDDESVSNNGISIPGYTVLKFTTGSLEQNIMLYNPDVNNCYFIVSIWIGGDELFRSLALYPGDEIRKVELSSALETGSYEGSIVYECYAIDGGEKLNGAKIDVEIEVK